MNYNLHTCINLTVELISRWFGGILCRLLMRPWDLEAWFVTLESIISTYVLLIIWSDYSICVLLSIYILRFCHVAILYFELIQLSFALLFHFDNASIGPGNGLALDRHSVRIFVAVA